MKKLILFEVILLFLATTFDSDNQPGWVQQTLPRTDNIIQDIFFIDSLNGWAAAVKYPSQDTGFIFKTTNGGLNWFTQYQRYSTFNAIQFINPNTGYSVGYDFNAGRGTIYKTTNSGTNWFIVNNSLIAVYGDLAFVNKDTGWVCIDNGFDPSLLKTTDGGVSLSPQLSQSFHIIKLFFLNKDTGWAINSDPQGKLYRTTNSGTNWSLQYTFSNQLKDIFFIARDTGWAIVFSQTNQNGIFISTNGGNNWVTQLDPSPAPEGTNKLFFINNKTGWIACAFSDIRKTTDQGANWFTQTNPSSDNVSIQFTDTLLGWAGGTKLTHTTDGGGPPVGIKKIGTGIPEKFNLFQNYPNPFNPITIINYQLSINSNVKIVVFDITGKQITQLADQKQEAGKYQVEFDGSSYSSGIYFYSLIVDDKLIDTKKMLMIK